MIKLRDKISILFILINICFLLYYSAQLLIFTDEFAIKNLGFFNHAIAGLCEILGIIFFCFSVGLLLSLHNGCKNFEPLFFTIFLIQIFISFNFWRYIFTDSPGETSIEIILMNAMLFSSISIIMLALIIRLFKIKRGEKNEQF